MIYWNGNEYRTLDQKLYYGGTQIAAAYWGNQLVYPEKKIEIDGIQIDVSPYYVNGNMYDTGIQATADTRFELCIIPNETTDNSRMIFGTHHDNWTNSMYFRQTDGTRGNKTDNLTLENNPYHNQTSFHLILADDNRKLRFRFGGTQKNSESSGTSGSDLNLNQTIRNKAFYTICLEDNGDISSSFDYGKYYWEQQYKSGKITKEKKEEHINTFTTVGSINTDNFSGESCHLWLNAINRYVTNPNEDRTNSNNSNLENLTYYYSTSKCAFVYLIIYKYSSSEGGVVSDKVMFTQRITNIVDPNNSNEQQNKIIVFDKYDWDFQSKKFKSKPVKTIYPFAYCKPL